MICKHARVCITLYTPQTVASSTEKPKSRVSALIGVFPADKQEPGGGGRRMASNVMEAAKGMT
jgi:hypothetical protein